MTKSMTTTTEMRIINTHRNGEEVTISTLTKQLVLPTYLIPSEPVCWTEVPVNNLSLTYNQWIQILVLKFAKLGLRSLSSQYSDISSDYRWRTFYNSDGDFMITTPIGNFIHINGTHEEFYYQSLEEEMVAA